MIDINFYKKHSKTDLIAGLVVFLIALPLCLGIAITAQAPLFSGIIAGAVGGIILGFLSQSEINVSGPAASVALVIVSSYGILGNFENILVAGLLAGLIQIAMGFVKAGVVAYFFPNIMIKGILASIGLVLIINQIPNALGNSRFFDLDFRFQNLNLILENISLGASLITLFSVLILILWNSNFIKSKKILKEIPGALVAVIFGISLNQIFGFFWPTLKQVEGQLVNIPIAQNFQEFKNLFSFPNYQILWDINILPDLFQVALTIAFIASLETLLSTEAGDKIDPYRRNSSTNHELKAQGVGNIISSILGGLPVTAVIIRTSANVEAGGRTRISTITHGFLMIVLVFLIPSILNLIPLASLAGVLFVVGYNLTSTGIFLDAYRKGWKEFLPFITTILVVLFFDLISGIIVGGGIAVFFVLLDNYQNTHSIEKLKINGQEVTKIKLSEEITFLNKAELLNTLKAIPENSSVLVDRSNCKKVHPDILDILEDFKVVSELKNIQYEVKV